MQRIREKNNLKKAVGKSRESLILQFKERGQEKAGQAYFAI